MGSFWVNLNQTGQHNDYTRVEVFSYVNTFVKMAEMVQEEEGESGQARARAINLILKRTSELWARFIPPGKVLIVLVDTRALGNLIEAAQRSEATDPVFD